MTAPRDTEHPLPLLRAARGVFDLTLEGMIWSRRSLLMALLLGLPVVCALVYRVIVVTRSTLDVSGGDLYGFIVALYYVRNALPLAALYYATSLIADEVEGKTMTYLLTRPVPRAAILGGKFAAYLATTLCLSLPATVITSLLLATSSDLLADLGIVGLTLLVYGAFFTLVGVLLRRPVVPGLLFLFGWEFLANLPGYAPRLTITGYLRSLLRHRPPEEGFFGMLPEVLPSGLCLGVLGVLTLLALAGAAWIFSGREYVLDQ